VTTQKNIPLLVPACEKVAAVKHRNTNDIWVIAHKYGTNEFCVYLIDCTGLRTTPLTIAVGNTVDKLSNSIGYLKASPDGNTLAMAAFTSVVEVFDFDALTGNITNPRIIAGNPNSNKITGPYGIEFSGNSKLLYVSESYNSDASGGWFIYQYVIDTPNIADSKVAIDSGYGNAAGALQLGPDDKIYIAYDQQPYVGAITAPDMAGVGCGHVKQYVPFPAGILSGVGLPSCVAGYKRNLLGSDTAMCAGGRKLFRIDLPGTDFLWQNGSTPDSFVATAPGVYWLQIRYNNCTYRDTINIHYKPNPPVNLGRDTAICENKFPLLLQQTIPGATYLWQDGSTQPLYQVNKAGLYYVRVSSNGCSQSDTIAVRTQFLPEPNLGPDKTLCAGLQLVLNPGTTGTSYVWQDGSTRGNYTVTQTGVYSVSVSNECGMQSDEIVVKEGTCAVAIPNAFTPGKSQNNIFRVLNASALKSFSLRVLNRWGQLMYQTTDPLHGWDGSLNGTPQPVGTYVYIVSYAGPATTNVVRKGVLVLVR
jgi:gliding motility-associated-like protein